MAVTIKKELWTPNKAKRVLEHHNYDNRPFSDKQAKTLVSARRASEWEDTGETIKFNGENLVDGQHRLTMIVETGQSTHLWTARGLSPKAWHAMDQGLPRQLFQHLAADGEEFYQELAAALKYLHVFKSHKPSQRVRERFRIPFGYTLLEKNGGIRKLVKFVKLQHTPRVGIPVGMTAACYYVAKTVNKELAEDIWPRFVTGENLHAEEPIFRLRKKLLDDHNRVEKVTTLTKVLWFIKVWQAHLNGETLDRIILTAEDYDRGMKQEK